ERGVARDQVERLSLDGSEEAPLAALDVVELVERGVQLRVRERAVVHVGRDHALCMASGEERVDTAPGPHVERLLHARARGEQVARARGRRVRRDVVGRIVRVAREPVRGEQRVVDRNEAPVRYELVAAPADEIQSEKGIDPAAAERGYRLALGDGELQV